MRIYKIGQLSISRPVQQAQPPQNPQSYIGRKIISVMSKQDVFNANAEIIKSLALNIGDYITPVRENGLNGLRENYYRVDGIDPQNKLNLAVLDSNRIMNSVDLFATVQGGRNHGQLLPRWKKIDESQIPQDLVKSF